jgi:hypothetical protein
MPSLFDTLEQDEMWYGQDGYPYVVDEMETSHIRNLIGFLQRRADNIYKRHQWHEARLMESAPDDVFDGWMAEQRRAIPSDPLEWLNRRPLMQKLERVLRLRESIEPDSLHLEGAQ